MGKINNNDIYKKDRRITINDQVIGSDMDNVGVTKNYPLSDIVSFINEANDIKFSMYKYSTEDAETKKGVFNINGTNFKLSNTDLEGNDNSSVFEVFKNNKEHIIFYLKDGADSFGYYVIKNATKNSESYTFELELIANIKVGTFVLDNTYLFNFAVNTSTSQQIQSDWNQSDSQQLDFIKNKPALAPADAEKNVQSDWNQTNTGEDDFIKNKPVIPDPNAGKIKFKYKTALTGADGEFTSSMTQVEGQLIFTLIFRKIDLLTNDVTLFLTRISSAGSKAILKLKRDINRTNYLRITSSSAQTDTITIVTEAVSGLTGMFNNDDIYELDVDISERQQIQADWNQTFSDQLDYIKNKPPIVQVYENFAEMTSVILNQHRPIATDPVGTIIVNPTRNEVYVRFSETLWHKFTTTQI